MIELRSAGVWSDHAICREQVEVRRRVQTASLVSTVLIVLAAMAK